MSLSSSATEYDSGRRLVPLAPLAMVAPVPRGATVRRVREVWALRGFSTRDRPGAVVGEFVLETGGHHTEISDRRVYRPR